jgi:hypothetical protein
VPAKWKERKKKKGTRITKMHVGLANATAQTQGGQRGEQRRTSIVRQGCQTMITIHNDQTRVWPGLGKVFPIIHHAF